MNDERLSDDEPTAVRAIVEQAVKEVAEAASDDRTIENDLERRRLRNEQRDKNMNLFERWVLGLKIDWNKFHERHCRSTPFPCDHTTTVARRILAKMRLDKKAIGICLQYFAEVGGGCDCEIALNVDMTNPRPRCDFRCRDCGNDYDEYYMVHNHVWKAGGLPKDGGMLCIGCLEKRIGRRLCRDDFPDWEVKRPRDNQSLRLKDRIAKGAA